MMVLSNVSGGSKPSDTNIRIHTYPYTGNSISSRPHTRTLDEPLSCSSSFILSKQYNIIYTYNMGHDLYLPAHVVNTKG